MDKRVAVAAIVSAIASSGVAVAVSYRLWGADVVALREREIVVEAAIAELDKRRIKTDDDIIALIDTFKKADEKFQIARASKPQPLKWYCSLSYDSPGRAYVDGICETSLDDCFRTRMEQTSMGNMAGACIEEPTVFCFSGGGTAGCHPSAASCERHRQQVKLAVVPCEQR